MWRVFVILYISYLILGPHWISYLIQKKPLKIVDSPKEFFRRSIFISYISLLYTSWFLYNPNFSTFMNALILSGAATAGFYTKYGPEEIPMHIFLNVFLMINGYKFLDKQTITTIFLVIFYAVTQSKLYLP